MQIALTVISWFILLLQELVNFPEKLSYDSEKCRTGKLNEFLAREGKFKALSIPMNPYLHLLSLEVNQLLECAR